MHLIPWLLYYSGIQLYGGTHSLTWLKRRGFPITTNYFINNVLKKQFAKTISDRSIECVRLTSSNSQIQNKRDTKGFILIGHKRYQIFTCLQLSRSIASFVWKPAHFELRSYGGAWHNTKIAFVEKYTLISWFLTILGVKVSGKVLF